jgi:prophage regulatory protein
MSEKFLRLAEVQRRVPYSRSTIYAKIPRGEFPAPIDLGARAVAWLESDIDEWIASRIAKGRALRDQNRAEVSL